LNSASDPAVIDSNVVADIATFPQMAPARVGIEGAKKPVGGAFHRFGSVLFPSGFNDRAIGRLAMAESAGYFFSGARAHISCAGVATIYLFFGAGLLDGLSRRRCEYGPGALIW
jgi:hypothetical protein